MAEHELGTPARPLRVAVIGSGPSAFYAVEALQKSGLSVRTDVFDRLPTPYGLVRGGVAPDHQKIKSVVRVYEEIAAREGFRFFGNVMLGRDVQVVDLLALYDQIVYAVGNERDRAMGIPGEDLAGVHSATSFVGWYNGHPDFRHLEFPLSTATRIAIVGNGNVAMDVARILAQSPDRLAGTDIADYALGELNRSAVREILLLGRRGPAQAAFSPKEIEEIGEMAEVDLVVAPADVEPDAVTARWLESSAAPRTAHRNLRYLTQKSKAARREGARRVRCAFLVAPVELIGKEGRLTAVRLQHNELVADAQGVPRPRGLPRFETEEVQLLFKAVGYRGVPLAGVPFDEVDGIVPNAEGRVLDARGGRVVPRQYVVGWAKRGPTGLIGTNSPDAKATVAAMLADLADAVGPAAGAAERGIEDLLVARRVDYVTYEDWKRLDRHEMERGAAKGKVRDKLTSVEEMMTVIRQLRGAR